MLMSAANGDVSIMALRERSVNKYFMRFSCWLCWICQSVPGARGGIFRRLVLSGHKHSHIYRPWLWMFAVWFSLRSHSLRNSITGSHATTEGHVTSAGRDFGVCVEADGKKSALLSPSWLHVSSFCLLGTELLPSMWSAPYVCSHGTKHRHARHIWTPTHTDTQRTSWGVFTHKIHAVRIRPHRRFCSGATPNSKIFVYFFHNRLRASLGLSQGAEVCVAITPRDKIPA